MDQLLVLLVLLCSESVRLVGGNSRCARTLQVKQGEWRPVRGSAWTLKEAAEVCRQLDCGSAVSVAQRGESSEKSVWRISSECVQSDINDCIDLWRASFSLDLTCSDSVRLVNGTSLCSGRLKVKSDQSDQSWSSVCEAAFDQQDAEVVCRELGCGAPLVLQGALYGEGEAPMWTKEFQCGGDESSLLDCRSSGSDRNSCSPGRAVGLTCSEPVRLVGGDSRCAGTLEVKYQGEWRPVGDSTWTLKEAAVVCRQLDCGFAVSVAQIEESSDRDVWWTRSDCVQSGSPLRECVISWRSSFSLNLTCSDSVRLVNGTSLCSGRLEVKSDQSDQSDQSWSSVCEAAFDQQDAEVVCRELGCGAPSVLQGVLYGEGEAPMWTKEFQCGGDESSLLDCRSSGSDRNTCSPGRAVGLTCSEPVRLVGGDSRCAGTLELKQEGEWRPVTDNVHFFSPHWTLKEVGVACRDLDCGSAVSVAWGEESVDIDAWGIMLYCIQSGSALRECVTSLQSASSLDLICSDFFHQPNISASSSMDEHVDQQQQEEFQVFKGSNFTISCSIQPQHPGGSFQLTFTSSNSTINYTQPAVNHSADFLFPAAEPAHQGSYSCVYHNHVFSHNFSSESQPLSVSVSDFLHQPSISASSSADGVSQAQQQGVFQVSKGSTFTISCSTQPQYPGGSFRLSFTSSNSTKNYKQPAVNHSADFLFPAAEPAHQGSYSCVYHAHVFSHNFSSESQQLSVSVSDPAPFIIRAVLLPLTFLLLNAALYFYRKATRGQKPSRQENTEMDYYNLGVPAAEGGPAEEEAAQGNL